MDVWADLLNTSLRKGYKNTRQYPVCALDIGHIESVSFWLRELLQRTCPEIVTVAEDFSENVVYVPVSALGCSPTPVGNSLAVRPKDIRPVWVHIPFLYALALEGLLLIYNHKTEDAEPARLIHRVGGILTCSLADGTVVNVPERCRGICLHLPSTGRPFLVPRDTEGTC
jgi:hypothetical protein